MALVGVDGNLRGDEGEGGRGGEGGWGGSVLAGEGVGPWESLEVVEVWVLGRACLVNVEEGFSFFGG